MDRYVMETLNELLSYPDVNWAYFHMMHPKTRDELDKALTEIQHPLAYEAGTNESRFKKLHASKFRF